MRTPTPKSSIPAALNDRWLDLAMIGAVGEEIFNDGESEGHCVTHPRFDGAISFGHTFDEAMFEFRSVLYEWAELGRKLGHSIPEPA